MSRSSTTRRSSRRGLLARIYPDLPGMAARWPGRLLPERRVGPCWPSSTGSADGGLRSRTSLGAYLRAPSLRAAGPGSRSAPCACLHFAEDARAPCRVPGRGGGRCLHGLARSDAGVPGRPPDPDTSLSEALKLKRDAVVQPAIQATALIANEIRTDPKTTAYLRLIEAEDVREPTLSSPAGAIPPWATATPGHLGQLPAPTFVALDRADHGWPMETPNLLPALIDDWLARMALAERRA